MFAFVWRSTYQSKILKINVSSAPQLLTRYYCNKSCTEGVIFFNLFYCLQAERGFATWAVFVGRTVVFVLGKGKGA
jgi:hypothetical protein